MIIMNKKLVKDAVFGAIGGAAGTFVLGKMMGFISRFQSQQDKWIERELVKEEPTEALARRAARAGFGVELNRNQKQRLGQAVHWCYGLTWGTIYGLMRHRVPIASKAAGLPFGVAFGFFGPGFLLPMFNLTPSAKEFPASAHIRGLLSHYAYTATVEGVCAGLEAIDRAVTRTPQRTKTEFREVA
jgi:hypothetical protein